MIQNLVDMCRQRVDYRISSLWISLFDRLAAFWEMDLPGKLQGAYEYPGHDDICEQLVEAALKGLLHKWPLTPLSSVMAEHGALAVELLGRCVDGMRAKAEEEAEKTRQEIKRREDLRVSFCMAADGKFEQEKGKWELQAAKDASTIDELLGKIQEMNREKALRRIEGNLPVALPHQSLGMVKCPSCGRARIGNVPGGPQTPQPGKNQGMYTRCGCKYRLVY